MSDTPDSAKREAERLLPCYGAYHGIIAGAVCSCKYRPAVAQALRAAKRSGGKVEAPRPDADCLIASISGAVTQEEAFRRGYRAGIEAAAKIADSRFAADGWNGHIKNAGVMVADAIRALAEKEQPAT